MVKSREQRIADVRAAVFRHKAQKAGKGLCLICKGLTYSPEESFCYRHYRQLPPHIKKRELKEEQVAYLQAPHPLRLLPTAKHKWQTTGGGFQLVQTDHGYRLEQALPTGTAVVGRFTRIAEAQTWLTEHQQAWSARNRYASKTMVRRG